MDCSITVEEHPKCDCDGIIIDPEHIVLPSNREAIFNLINGNSEESILYKCPDNQYHLIGHSSGITESGDGYSRYFLIKSCHDREDMIKAAEESLDVVAMRPMTKEEIQIGEDFRSWLRAMEEARKERNSEY
jgi:hypothetical protein